ncbi:MAG: VWA domain-containing protein [Acidobacteria bacterium]|nr:VWA domain-containing protein [Acidobacteriota bacterium]
MTFLKWEWLYLAVPLLLLMAIVRTWRRYYWGHSLVEGLREELGGLNPIFRLPTLLEASAVGFLLVALLEPVYPFVLNRIERGGLQIMIVLDLSQSMEEGIVRNRFAAALAATPRGEPQVNPLSKMEAVKVSATQFIQKRPGDAVGLAVFSNNAYVVSPATFDHDSLVQYLQMVSTQTLINEGFTAIGEGLFMANRFFAFNKKQGRRAKGQVIILFSDGDNNYGRDPMKEIEKARIDGTHIYFIGVALEPGGTSQEIAEEIVGIGGRYYDVSSPQHLDSAMDDINHLEKGRFYTLQLVRHQPAYFIFVLLSFACLGARLALNGIPHFVELS